MRIKASEIRKNNIGQIVIIDTLDGFGEESVVTGTVEGFERKSDRIIITTCGTEYEFDMSETVDIMRSAELNELIRQSEGPRPITSDSVVDLLEELVEPGSDFRLAIQEIIRETLVEVVQTELAEMRS